MLLKYRVGIPSLIEIIQYTPQSDVLVADWTYGSFIKDEASRKKAIRIVEVWMEFIEFLPVAGIIDAESPLGILDDIFKLITNDFLQPDEVCLEVFNATVDDCMNQPDSIIGKVPVFKRRGNNKLSALDKLSKYSDRSELRKSFEIADEVAEMIEKYERR